MTARIFLLAAALLAGQDAGRHRSHTRLIGFVQDTYCQPVQGVTVSLTGEPANAVVTDRQGRFNLPVSSTTERAQLTARVGGFRLFTRTGIRLTSSLRRDAHTLTLDILPLPTFDGVITTHPGRDDRRLRGEVLTTACTPIAGATASIRFGGETIAAQTDAGGSFTLGPFPPGSYQLRVQAPGFVPLARRDTRIGREATARVRILLERGDNGEADVVGGK